MSPSILRFEPFTTRQDPEVVPEYRAVCESGEDVPCAADSDTAHTAEAVDDWMRQHMQVTGHRCFRRTFTDFAELIPTKELRAASEPATVRCATT